MAGAGFIASHYLDEWLRPRLEARLNRELTGYTVRLPRVHLHILGFALTLHEPRITQNPHPEQPVADIERFDISVHWRALLHGKLVADTQIVRPLLHIDLKNLQAEVGDSTDLADKGWQRAVEALYPLKINHLDITRGELTYADLKAKRPLRVRDLWATADNIRNVRLRDEIYPSEFHIGAKVFDKGDLRINGWANFLAEPVAAVYAEVDLEEVELDALGPVAEYANLRIDGGVLAANGHVEYTPKYRVTQLRELTIDAVQIQYVHQPQTRAAEARRLEEARAAAKTVSNEPSDYIEVDELRIRNSRIGYVDETRDPHYELFLSRANIEIIGFTNQDTKKPARLSLDGAFTGQGQSQVTATFKPVNETPEFDLKLQIENTPLRAMNDLLRAHGDFDVVGGNFALYTELEAKNGRLNGYVKPLFSDVDVYDRRQDKEKPVFHEVYEALVGAVAGLLRSRNDEVATKADVSGRIDEPDVSTWQVVFRAIGNALFNTIVPGFESNSKKE